MFRGISGSCTVRSDSLAKVKSVTAEIGIAHAGKRSGVAVDKNIALVSTVRVDAREHFHQRRFPRAVLTHERMKLAFFQSETHTVKRLYAGELFDDVLHFE